MFEMDDKLREECGVAGVIGRDDAAYQVYLSLYALQHRGQEACGIVSFSDSGQTIHSKRSPGLINDVFHESSLKPLAGSASVGHVRYSTSGSKSEQNIQPFAFQSSVGTMAIAHNGNLTNGETLRKELENQGSVFRSSVDSEVFIHLLAKSKKKDFHERIKEVMSKVEGAYSLTILTKDRLYAVRDPYGFRPLVIGEYEQEGYIAVSETCALDLVGAKIIREVEPGEIVSLDPVNGVQSWKIDSPSKVPKFCSFEQIYFARPDSKLFNQEVYGSRKRIGAVLAEESPVECDTVIAVPDSGVPIAIGYGEYVKVPVELGLVRNHYVGRTFIQPNQNIRDFGVKLKLNAVSSVLKGKKVVVVDDSIVRGTTSVKIIRMLRESGAKEVHMRIGAPPITHSCFYGVDTPERGQLLAAHKNVEQMRQLLEADSLAFLSVAGLGRALGSKDSYCMACFTGRYPVKVLNT